MSLQAFWDAVRTAAERAASSKSADAEASLPSTPAKPAIRRSLPAAYGVWVAPEVVADIDARDFVFLSPEKRAELGKLVEEFTKVAQTVDPMSPATDAQRAEARPPLMSIAGLLEFDRCQDPEAFRLGKLVERELAGRLGEVARLEFKTGQDHTGDPGFWIWTYLSNAASGTDEQFLDNVDWIRPILDSVARKVAPDRWPYLSFRSIGEMEYLAEVQRAQ